MSNVSISDIGLALLVLDNEKHRLDMEYDDLEERILQLSRRQNTNTKRSNAIQELMEKLTAGVVK